MSLLADCYRKLTESLTSQQQPLRGYKVTNVNRSRKIGVACRDLQGLKEKACVKFNVTEDLTQIRIFLIDGSEIDEEYFSTLEPQTTLILCRPGENLLTEADVLYQLLKKVNANLFQDGEKPAELLTDKFKSRIEALHKIINKDNKRTMLSKRIDDPEWFEGLESYLQTKEAYLHRRCQDRIRGYLYRTISQIRSSEVYRREPKARKRLQLIIAFFKIQLRKDHYFGYYFDRSRAVETEPGSPASNDASDDETDGPGSCPYHHCPCKLGIYEYDRYIFGLDDDVVDAKKCDDEDYCPDNEALEDLNAVLKSCPFELVERKKEDMRALCDRTGEFKCSGVWNLKKCLYDQKHTINPYRSREELILFSTWNLDHRIERSRTIIPQILEASQQQENIEDIDVYEFYNNLFTINNLKLVHIVCHDKGSHK